MNRWDLRDWIACGAILIAALVLAKEALAP
jgi:hypothetical protein